MRAVLLDTHVWAWSLTGDPRLSSNSRDAISQASGVYVSSISFFEIGQKVRVGKWPEMQPLLGRLEDLLKEQGGKICLPDPKISLLAAAMEWAHRDPFDRIIAASAIQNGLALISADTAFDTLTSDSQWFGRIW